MLDGLRIMSKNIWGRAILMVFAGLIVVGFGFFGIRDVFVNFRANQLAKIGDVEIGAQQYRTEYQNELQRAEREARRAITNDEARRMGLDRQVLARLLTDSALDQAAQKLGLAISDAEIAKVIRADKMFAGPSGAFDQARLDEILRDNGYTENAYVSGQRATALRQQIGSAIGGSFRLPNVMLAAINTYTNETRTADYFVLPAPGPDSVAAPDAAAVKTFYDMRKDAYRTPEYRKVNVLTVSPVALAKAAQITDEAAQQDYDQTAAQRFSKPGKREVAQLTFSTQQAADKASRRIQGGEAFAAVAADKAAGGVLANLGDATKSAIFDKAVADAAFALPTTGVTAPIHGEFGWVLADVTQITPAQTQPFAAVKDQIKSEIAQRQARNDVQKLHDKVEDQRASGKTLADAAGPLGLHSETLVTDAAGAGKGENGQPGAPIAALAGSPALLKAIFASDVGVDNDAVSRKDGGYSWFEITAVDPSRQLSLDEVKPAVVAALRQSDVQKALAAKANALARKIDAGASLAELAAANGARPQQAQAIFRGGGQGLTSATVAQVFGTPVGGAGVALADQSGRVVFKVTGSTTPPLDAQSPSLAKLLPQLQSLASDDLLNEYLAGLQQQLGLQVNQAALSAATGSQQ